MSRRKTAAVPTPAASQAGHEPEQEMGWNADAAAVAPGAADGLLIRRLGQGPDRLPEARKLRFLVLLLSSCGKSWTA